MSAVAVVSIALVCTSIVYYERWRVHRWVRARAQARWQRLLHGCPTLAERPIDGSRTEADGPLGAAFQRAVHAGDVASAYQRRFDATYRGWETPFEFKRSRVEMAHERFEGAFRHAGRAAESWLTEQPETEATLPLHRALRRVCDLVGSPPAREDRLAFLEARVCALDNARLLLRASGRHTRASEHPFRGLYFR